MLTIVALLVAGTAGANDLATALARPRHRQLLTQHPGKSAGPPLRRLGF